MAISIVNPFVSDNNPAALGSEVNFSMLASSNATTINDFGQTSNWSKYYGDAQSFSANDNTLHSISFSCYHR